MHALRFGLSWSQPDPVGWRRLARDIEAIGYQTLYVSDHFVEGMLAPFAALAVAAEVTERIHVGTLVLNNDFRHPVAVAREAATLSILSGGRFELGLGAGHMRSEYDEVGIPFAPASIRAARLAEAASIVRRLLAGETVSHTGEHYRISGHRLEPTPPATPLLIGGNGDRVLRAAALEADAVSFTGFGPSPDGADVSLTHFSADGLADRIAHVQRHAGPRFDDLRLQVLVQAVHVTSAAREVVERYSAHWRLPPETVADSPFLLIGTVDDIAMQLQERSQRFGVSEWVTRAESRLSDQRLGTLAPVIERLA